MLSLSSKTPAAETNPPKYIGWRTNEYIPETTNPLTSGVILKLLRKERSPIIEIMPPQNTSKGGIEIGTLGDAGAGEKIRIKIGTFRNAAGGEITRIYGRNEPSKEIKVGRILE